jgi:signal peptidase I
MTMRPSNAWHTRLQLIVTLVLLGIGWVMLAPVQIGGQTAYVIVSGNSMEPGFHLGDLAIVRAADDYGPGDVVTYRHPTIGLVIHRILSREHNRFVLKGDNNSWLDSYQPTSDEIVGRLWLHIPSAGAFVRHLRTPGNMALLTGLLGAFLMVSVQGSTGKQIRGAHNSTPRRPPAGATLLGEAGQNLASMLALVACLSLALAVFAFTRPVQRQVSEDITYRHSGTFSYEAEVPAGVYDTTTVATGEPIFRRLASSMQVGFTYQLQADQPGEMHGYTRLLAVISDVNGWKRTLELAPETPFTGGAATIEGLLDLQQVQALIDGVEQQTGVHREQYTLAVVPEVVVDSAIGGQQLHETFAPRLVFQMDATQLQLVGGETAGATSQLQPVQPGMVKRERTEPNTLSLLMFDLDVVTARRIALLGLDGSLAGLAALALYWRRARTGHELPRIHAQHGARIIKIAEPNFGAGERMIDVASFEDLAKLVAQDGRMILHREHGTIDHFYVQDAGLIYHYATDERAVEEAA